MASSNPYYVPFGTANLAAIFPGIDFSVVEEYFIEVMDGSTILGTSPSQLIGICPDEDRLRIHFLNYLGALDALNFKIVGKTHEVTSGSYQQPTSVPLIVTQHSINRFNGKSNDSYTASLTMQIIHESDKNYFEEILDSPLAWLEAPIPNTYYPIVILDKKTEMFQKEDRYYYELLLEFKMSHERIIIRN